MSSGLYALIGVVLGGGVTAGSQIVVGLFTAKRRERREWRTAARLVSEELARLIIDLRGLIEHGIVPPLIDERFLATELWEQYRSVLAGELADDDAGDNYWRALAAIFSTTSHRLRPALAMLPPGSPLPEGMVDALRDGFVGAWGAYEALNGVPPPVRPLLPEEGGNDDVVSDLDHRSPSDAR